MGTHYPIWLKVSNLDGPGAYSPRAGAIFILGQGMSGSASPHVRVFEERPASSGPFAYSNQMRAPHFLHSNR